MGKTVTIVVLVVLVVGLAAALAVSLAFVRPTTAAGYTISLPIG